MSINFSEVSTKLVLVIVLAAIVGMISSKVRKAKMGDVSKLKSIPTLGRLGLLTGILIVILAVYIFH